METMRDIKRRINSVQNTQKITKAMKMVAAAKLRRAQDMAEDARPFFEKTRKILSNVTYNTKDSSEHPLIKKHEGKSHLYIVINSDRGLCGAYNSRVVNTGVNLFDSSEDTALITIGKNARDFFKKRNYDIFSEYINIDDYPDYRFAYRISEEVIELFTEGETDKVSLIYTYFNSAISQEIKVVQLLPVTHPGEDIISGDGLDIYESSDQDEESSGLQKGVKVDKEKSKDRITVEYLFEPSADDVFDVLLPRYVNNVLYSALLEAKASEFGARMTAMDSATDNAEELIDNLTLSYNRARQAAITKEITEIVGGAEALK